MADIRKYHQSRGIPRKVNRALTSQMIVISTTVGVGFFVNSGDTMALAGPGATILAFAVVGLIAWGAMDGLSEMVVFWPVPNPLVQFVQTFVDRDLGTVVHFAYW